MDDIVGYTCYGLPAVFNPQWAKNMKTLQEYLYFPNYFCFLNVSALALPLPTLERS